MEERNDSLPSGTGFPRNLFELLEDVFDDVVRAFMEEFVQKPVDQPGDGEHGAQCADPSR